MTDVFIQSLLILSGAVSLFIATSSTISWLRILNLAHVDLITQELIRLKVALMISSTLKDLEGGQVTIYPDFIRRCILFVENVGDYQVKQHSEKLVEVCLSRRDEQLETAIIEQFQVLAQQKEFKEPEIQFSDYHWDTSRKLKRIQRL